MPKQRRFEVLLGPTPGANLAGVGRDTISDVTAIDSRAAFRERILQTRNGMLDHVHYVTQAFDGREREELTALHREGLVELKAMASWKPLEWRSLTEYEDAQAFWDACERDKGVRVRIVAATDEINAMSPEQQRAAWEEINAWFIARVPV